MAELNTEDPCSEPLTLNNNGSVPKVQNLQSCDSHHSPTDEGQPPREEASSPVPDETTACEAVAENDHAPTSEDSFASQRTGIYTNEDCLVFRLHKIVQTVAIYVLQLVLTWATQDKASSLTYFEYFSTVKNTSKAKLRTFFKAKQMETLKTDASANSFDVTQLFGCISCVYEDTDAPMEHVRYIKNFRNLLMHTKLALDDETFRKTVDDLRFHFAGALQKAAELKNIPDDVVADHLREMENTLNRVISEQIVQWDVTSYENELRFEEMQRNVLTLGKENLKSLYKQWAYITPLSFLSRNTHFHVGMVFTQLEIVESGWTGENDLIEYQDLFQLYTNKLQERGTARIILVEGPAGSGKTTLTKMVLDNWTKQIDALEGLTDFQLVLYTECRNVAIKNFGQLLTVLMPSVAKKYREDELVSCVLACKVLLIVDALDEMTSASRKLFEEILSHLQTSDFTLLVTSRPESVEDFYKMIPLGTDTVHVKIKGIPEGKREEFALKYHSELERTDERSRDTLGLVNYLRRTSVCLKDHWRLPLHLAMVVILWVFCPEALNGITTATELFTVTESLRDEKLAERIKKNEQCKSLCVKEIKEKIEHFRLCLYKISLYGRKEGDIVLTEDSLDKLEKTCKILQLPDSEVLGAFFVKKIGWMGTGTQMQYSFAHKGTQDFYGALHIRNVLQGKACPEALEQMNSGCVESWQKLLSLKKKSILNILKDVYKSNPDDFSLKKFQNLLIHLTGLVANEVDFNRKEVSSEIIKLLRKSGIADEQAWLDILSDIKLNETTRKEISKYLPDIMNLNGHMEITDSRVEMYAKMIVHAGPTRITAAIDNDPMQVPYLQDLLEAMCYQKGEIELYFYHNFLYPCSDTLNTESPLPQLFQKAKVMKFMGHIDQGLMRKLPEGLKTLCVAVVDERHCQMMMPKVASLRNLEWLWINARATVDLKQYPQLQRVNYLYYRSKEKDLFVRKVTKSPLELSRLETLLSLIDSKHGEEASMAFRCNVEMQLTRDFQCSEGYDKGTDVGFQRIFSRFKVTVFRGCLGYRAMRSLPKTIRMLSLIIVDDEHYKSLEPTLHSLQDANPLLRRLSFHICRAVNPSVLRNPPKLDCWFSLWMDKLDDSSVEWACKVAHALQPDEWYSGLVLPDLKMSLASFTELVEKLAAAGVTILRGGGLLVPTSWATPDIQPEVETLTRSKLQCSLFVLNDDIIWQKNNR